MKLFFKTVKGKIVLAVAVLLLIAGAAFGGYEYWLYRQPKFHDLTIELGTASIGMDQFTTEYARLKKCRFVTDVSTVNIGQVGNYSLTLAHGKQEELVVLSVEDTTAPSVKFLPRLEKDSDFQPVPEDFVESFSDYSAVTISYAKEPVFSETYDDVTVEVVVTDAEGNQTAGKSVYSTVWLKQEVTMELGTQLTKEDILLNPEKDASLIDQKDLDKINSAKVGQYPVVSATADKTMTCTVTVEDTTAPTLVLKNKTVYPGKSAELNDFVESCEDASGEVELKLLTELKTEEEGHFEVTVEAKDASGNVASGTAMLIVSTDQTPPVISKLRDLTVEKHSKPDFLDGITAKDAVDGECEVTVDLTKINLDKAGTYYLTYSAADKSGNVATEKRKIIVEHDEEDTKALADSIAATLENDPEKIRDYVRKTIAYNHSWGGDDPAWFGFTTHTGNCYVHAQCLDLLLKYYGYETQLIWTTNKTHYWLLINLDGIGWRHIDATPSTQHGRYSLMTDKQRLSTLSGRRWDTTLWPAAEEKKAEEPAETVPEETVPEVTLPDVVTTRR